MLYINKITADASQQINLTGIPGIIIGLDLRWFGRNNLWVADISYNNTLIQGVTVTESLNFLRQWKNILPFGISCLTTTGFDPSTVNDFVNQTANMYLLNSDDVAGVEAYLSSQTP